MKPGGHRSHCAEQENHPGPAWRGCDEELVATGRREGGGQWGGGVILVQEEKSVGNEWAMGKFSSERKLNLQHA